MSAGIPAVLYLHGFSSSPQSLKARLLADALAARGLGDRLCCPFLSHVPDAAIAARAIPASKITCITGAQLQTKLAGYLQVLFEADPASAGGALPSDDFYHQPRGLPDRPAV